MLMYGALVLGMLIVGIFATVFIYLLTDTEE
jgi:hypothetical protein